MKLIRKIFVIVLSAYYYSCHAQWQGSKDTTIINDLGDTLNYHVGWLDASVRYNSTNSTDSSPDIRFLTRDKVSFYLISGNPFRYSYVQKRLMNLAFKIDSAYSFKYGFRIANTTSFLESESGNEIHYLPGPAKFNFIELANNLAPNGTVEPIYNEGVQGTSVTYFNASRNRFNGLCLNSIKFDKARLNSNVLSNMLLIGDCQFNQLTVSHNEMHEFTLIKCAINKLELIANDFTDCSEPALYDPNGNVSEPVYERVGYLLINDTILESLYIQNFKDAPPFSKISPLAVARELRIENCVLDCPMQITGAPFDILTFQNCSFGPKFSIDGAVDTLVFVGSCSFAQKFDLRHLSSNRGTIKLLFLDDVEVKNFRFEYRDDYQFLKDIRQERALILFKEKYASEGNTESAKRVDIELKQLRYAKTGSGFLMNFLDWGYWGYGYDLTRPVWIIFTILICFTLFNIKFWDAMNRAYTIGDEEMQSTAIQLVPIAIKNEQKKHRFQSKYFAPRSNFKQTLDNFGWAFIYTAIIFFSIRIAKDRLHFNGNGKAIIAYFSQYLLGLFLLVITVKFVFGL